MIEPQAAPPEPVKITTEFLDYLEGLYAGTVTPTGPVLIPVPELVAAARLGARVAWLREHIETWAHGFTVGPAGDLLAEGLQGWADEQARSTELPEEIMVALEDLFNERPPT